MLNRKMKPIAAAVGAAFAATMATNVVADEADPFEASLLDDGVILSSSHKEGGCGEDKEKGDGDDHEGKCGEGKCGEEGESEGAEAEDAGDADDSGESDDEGAEAAEAAEEG